MYIKTKKEYEGSSTVGLQDHIPCGFAYKLICCYNNKYTKDIVVYRGTDTVSKFIESILEEEEYCEEIMKKDLARFSSIEDMIITPEQEKEFEESTICHICHEKYSEKDIKVRDHCHMTGLYRGAAHNSCNLNYQLSKNIPVVFHNLRGYDGHLIVQELGKYSNELNKDIGIIPNNMEKYMGIMFRNLVFIDSFQFIYFISRRRFK